MNRFFDLLMKRSRSERLLLFGIAYAVIAAVFYFVLISPTVASIADMSKQQKELSAKRDEVKRRAANRAQFEIELARMSDDLKEALKQLPNDREIPGLLSEIDEQGRKAGLEVRKFQPLPEVMHEYYAEVPVSIVMDGAYHEVGSFFDAVRQMDRIVSVADITLANPQDVGGDTSLTISGKAVTYRFLTDEEIARKKNDPGKKGKKKKGGGGEE